MLNFRGLFEKLFKSFRPGGDTEMVLKLVEDDIRHVMIIKRYWLYGVFMMWWRLFISFLLSVANLWLAYENF